MVHALDINVGRLLTSIDDFGIADNTMIIFTSDNGGLTTITNSNWTAPTSVKPLRAGKGWCYEGGIRVPLLVKTPGMGGSSVCDEPVISMDFYPTILEIAGVPDVREKDLDGIILTSLLKKTGLPGREDIFWHYPHYHTSGWTPGAAVRSGQWKLIEFYESGEIELYKLDNDPGEENNLANTHPGKVEELHAKLKSWQEKTGARFPVENANYVPE